MAKSCKHCTRWTCPANGWSTCTGCVQKLVTEKGKLADELKRLMEDKESRLAFLRLQYDSDLAKEIPEGFDVAIIVNNEAKKPDVFAHKLVLANRSSVFRRMLGTPMLESETGLIQIDDATLPVIRAVIRFCYTAEIDFSPEVTAEEVLAVAHKYAIACLQRLCEEDLVKMIDKVSLPKLLTLAKKFEAKGLQKEALKYLKDHFDDVIVAVVDELFEN